MNFLRRFYQQQTRQPRAYSLVDIGRDTVKAVVILVQPDLSMPQIIGYGLAETGGRDIAGGRLEAAAITSPVNIALTQAEDRTEAVIGKKIVPDDVIFAVNGQATVGKLFTVRQTRSNPAAPISTKELSRLRQQTEQVVRQGLAELSIDGGQWQALAVNDAGLRLDGHLVLDGVGLTGREVKLSLFGVAVQATAKRALETLAQRLDLKIVNILSAAQALTAAVPHSEAIILDIGVAGTNACLIRNDALVATGWIPFGGGFFTQAIAEKVELSFNEAKQLKHAFTAGQLTLDEINYLDELLDRARYRWYKSVINLLKKLSENKPFPWKIYLTGGGSLLPELDQFLRSDPTPFYRAPEVSRLDYHLGLNLRNLTDGLNNDLFTLALSLTVGLPE